MRLFVAMSILIFAIINAFLGGLLVCCCLYMLTTVTTSGYIPWNSYLITIPSILIATGIYMLIISIIMFIAIKKRSSTALKVSSAFLGVFLILKITAASFFICKSHLLTSEINKFLHDAVIDKMEYHTYNLVRPIDLIHISFQCCGQEDYRDLKKSIDNLPRSCCSAFNGCDNMREMTEENTNGNKTGCLVPIYETVFKKQDIWIYVVGIVICLIDGFIIGFSLGMKFKYSPIRNQLNTDITSLNSNGLSCV